MAVILDKVKDGYVEYDTVFVEPQSLAVLNNDIAMNILRELTFQPMCAMDLARKLAQHEQKIYYHLNKLQKSGLIKLVGTEKRYGMVAQLFDIVSPVVATKIHDNGRVVNKQQSSVSNEMTEFLLPFVKDGRLNSTIIIGNTQPHGKYGESAREGSYVADIAMFLGNFLKEIPVPCYKFDTQISEIDLKNNLIVIGNPKTNVIIDKINGSSPIKFDPENDFAIISTKSGKVYKDKHAGAIALFDNPFSLEHKILLIGGKQARGTRAGIIGFIRNIEQLSKEAKNGSLTKIVMGHDRDSDYEIDDVEIIE